MAKARKLNTSAGHAVDYYEEWMEPDWRSSTAASESTIKKTAPQKNRSKFKFADEYERSVTASSKAKSLSASEAAKQNALKANGNSPLSRAKSAPDLGLDNLLGSQLSNKDGWKPVDFSKFYKWVTNGTLTDLYKVKTLLFEE